MSQTCTVVVKTLSSYQTLRKLSRFSHKSPAGIKEEDVLSRGGCFVQLTTVQVKKKGP